MMANIDQPSLNKDFEKNKNSTMAIKVNFSLDTVRICCAVGIGNFKILKWNKIDAQSWEDFYVTAHFCERF